MKKKYKILILSNLVASGLKDDTIVKESFEKDGHIADLKAVDYSEEIDENYDVIIRRNTWVSSEDKTADLFAKNANLIKRLQAKKIKTVNLVGLDGVGKYYLCDLFKKDKNVIPTIKSLQDLNLIPDNGKYVMKDIKSFGNGLYQQILTKEDLIKKYKEGDVIQPFMSFKAELQCYYVGQKLMYAFEYTPSKYPHYPEPILIALSESEKQLADKYAAFSGMKHGFQRIDFIRLSDNSLILLEIEDHAAFMNLQRLPNTLQKDVMTEFKNNIYDLINNI